MIKDLKMKPIFPNGQKPLKGTFYMRVVDADGEIIADDVPQGEPFYACPECQTRLAPAVNIFCQTCGTRIDWNTKV